MLPHTNHTRALNFLAKLSIGPALLLLVAVGSIRSEVADSDILYVGEAANNTVRRFNANTGSPISGGSSSGVFVKPGSGGLLGPRGVLVKSGRLLVVNQNVGQPKPGEVLRYKLNDGALDNALVSSIDPHAPFLPRGIVSWRGIVYVADLIISDTVADPGRLLAFDENTGKFLREFSPPNDFAYNFHPRGLVIGPNGLLYVANVPKFPPVSTGGEVLVFDPETLNFIGAFIIDAGGSGRLNRPEGLVFGPDGNLYITSFRVDESDTDSIRIYDGHSGVFKGKIDLYAIGQPRAFAQALLFGPGRKLFVPISGGDSAGQVRRYDLTTSPPTYDEFVPAPPPDTSALWYLTFGKTNPGTLAYEGHGDPAHAGGGNILPPTAKPKGYSLSDIAKATAFFSTSAPNDRSKETEPDVPFQILYTSGDTSNTFSVRPGTMLYVPIFFADDSEPIFGNFPSVNDPNDPNAVANYFFSREELGAELLQIAIDGKITRIKEDSGYIVGVEVPQLADGKGTHYLTAAVFLTPLTKGTHSVTIQGNFTGDALPTPGFAFDITYTVIVN